MEALRPPSVVTSGEPATCSLCIEGAWCIGVKTGGVCEEDDRGGGGLVSLGEGTDMMGKVVVVVVGELRFPGVGHALQVRVESRRTR